MLAVRGGSASWAYDLAHYDPRVRPWLTVGWKETFAKIKAFLSEGAGAGLLDKCQSLICISQDLRCVLHPAVEIITGLMDLLLTLLADKRRSLSIL